MMHLLEDTQEDDPDDPGHRVMGINLTEKQEREMLVYQAERRHPVRRALARLTGRKSRVIANPAA